MLKWALIFAVVAVIAGLLGFTGIAEAAAGDIAKFLFFLFLGVVAFFPDCRRLCGPQDRRAGVTKTLLE